MFCGLHHPIAYRNCLLKSTGITDQNVLTTASCWEENFTTDSFFL